MADEHRIAAPARLASGLLDDGRSDDGRRPAATAEGTLTFETEAARTHRISGDVLGGLIAECYDAGVGSQPWERFLARLSDGLDCSGAALMTQSTTRNENWVLWSSGPIPERALGCPPPVAALAPRCRPVARASFECWAYWHDALGHDDRGHDHRRHYDRRPEAWIWPRSLCGLALSRTDEAISLRAWRGRAADPFGEAEQRLFAELVPHVGKALGIHWHRQRCAAEGNAVLSVLDRFGEAVFIVDLDGRVAKSNQAADSMVRQRRGWSMIGDRLMPAAAKYRESFRRSLVEVLSEDGRQDHARTVRLALAGDLAVPPVPVAVTRLDHSSVSDDRERPLAAVISKDPMQRSAMLTPELAATYQLTRSEARLAGMIVNGDSLIDAAAKLKISKNTARSHMKRIYVKTGTQNHADLVRTLSRSFLPLFTDEDEQIETGTESNLLN